MTNKEIVSELETIKKTVGYIHLSGNDHQQSGIVKQINLLLDKLMDKIKPLGKEIPFDFIKLNSVGTVIDEKGNTYPMNKDGTYDDQAMSNLFTDEIELEWWILMSIADAIQVMATFPALSHGYIMNSRNFSKDTMIELLYLPTVKEYKVGIREIDDNHADYILCRYFQERTLAEEDFKSRK